VQWLVTERASGGSLEAWLASRGRLSLVDLLDLLRSVMAALVYLHSRVPAVLHRDVKPANVLVFTVHRGGIVWKLGDVGIAKVLQATQHARTGAGTPMYAALDMFMGPYDGRVDVFSTGIMAAELVVRYVDIATFARVPASQYRFPDQRPALVEDACARLDTVCAALSTVVRRCSAMMPADRVTSGVALRALQEIDLGDAGGAPAAGHGGVAAPSVSGGGGGGDTATAVRGVAVAGVVPPPAAAVSQTIDMSIAAEAMVSLQIPTDVANRVCDAMTAVADERGRVGGGQLLRIVVDEGVAGLAAMELRRRLGITAAVPPRRVRPCLCVGVAVIVAAWTPIAAKLSESQCCRVSGVLPCDFPSCVWLCMCVALQATAASAVAPVTADVPPRPAVSVDCPVHLHCVCVSSRDCASCGCADGVGSSGRRRRRCRERWSSCRRDGVGCCVARHDVDLCR
jgi:hypothetical protein